MDPSESSSNLHTENCKCCLKIDPLIECLTPSDEDKLRIDYLDRWKYLDGIDTAQQSTLDTMLLTVSGTLLAFSTFFIEKLVSFDNAEWLPILFSSWISLLLSTVATLASFKLSAAIASEQIPILDYRYENPSEDANIYSRVTSKYAGLLSVANSLGFWGFIIGVTLLTSFVAINIDKVGQTRPPIPTTQITINDSCISSTHSQKEKFAMSNRVKLEEGKKIKTPSSPQRLEKGKKITQSPRPTPSQNNPKK